MLLIQIMFLSIMLKASRLVGQKSYQVVRSVLRSFIVSRGITFLCHDQTTFCHVTRNTDRSPSCQSRAGPLYCIFSVIGKATKSFHINKKKIGYQFQMKLSILILFQVAPNFRLRLLKT